MATRFGAFLCAAVFATAAVAADKTFTGPGNFSDATRWSGGTLPTAGQSLEIDGSCTFDTAAGTTTYGALGLGNGVSTGSVTFQAGGSAVLHITDIVSFTTGGAIDMTSGGTLQVDGTWNTAGMSFTAGAGTVIFGGTGQTIPGLTYNNLTIANGGTLGGDVTAAFLQLTAGLVTTGSNAFALTGGLAGGGGRIYGKFTRTLAATFAPVNYFFPLGTPAGSSPLGFGYNQLATAGTITFGITAGEHPQIGTAAIDSSRDVNAYWTFYPGTALFNSVSVSLDYGTNYDAAAKPASFVTRAYRNGAWFAGTGTGSGMPQTDWVIGNNILDHYAFNTIASQLRDTGFAFTLLARDAFDVAVGDASATVTMTSSSGHVTFDLNLDGNYTDTSQAITRSSTSWRAKDNTLETVSLTASDGTHTGTSNSFQIVESHSGTKSVITASPPSIPLGGTSTITVQVKGTDGTNNTMGGANVALSTTLGTLSTVTDNNDGTYTATLTGGSTRGTANITGTVNFQAIGTTTTVTIGVLQRPRSDINNDGRSDIVWRNLSTGNNSAWYVNGSVQTGTVNYDKVINASLDIAGVGDFNGDGSADLLWRNSSTGENSVWFLNGSLIGGYTLPTVNDAGLAVAGVGDFNADGFADILWRNNNSGENSVWYCNASGLVGGGYLPSVTTPGFTVISVADFNGDGKSDILWRNTSNGENYTWLMDGITLIGGSQLPTISSSGLSIAATGDFNFDGTADILWRNPSTGANSIWTITNGNLTGGSELPAVTDPALSIAAAGDFDGDGDTDLMWRNSSNGQVLIWLIENGTLAGGGQSGTQVSATSAKAPGPR